MLVFGLTGSIGSGKTTVGRLLAAAGVPVVDADRIAREVVEPGTPGLLDVAARFPGMVGPDGRLDRRALGARVFADPDELAALDRILHPRIAAEAVRRLLLLQLEGAPLAVYEAALIVELGLHRGHNGLIVVTAPEEEQVRRVAARDGASPAEVRARIAAQLSQAEKARAATWVIDNGGSPDQLRAEVSRVLGELRARAAAAGSGRGTHG